MGRDAVLGFVTKSVDRAPRRTTAWTLAAIVVAFVVVAALISNGLRLMKDQERARLWELHSYEVLLASKDLLAAVGDSQAGERGFLIAQNADYLQPFGMGEGAAPVLVERLAKLTQDNPRQVPRVAALRDDVAAYLAVMRDSVTRAANGDAASAEQTIKTGADKRRMDEIRNRVSDFVAEENRLLRVRAAHSRSDAASARNALFVLSAAGLLLLVIAAFAVFLAVRSTARLRLAAVERRAASDLEQARDFLLAIVDGASEPIYAKDREGRFLLANLETAKIYGVDRDALIGKRDSDFATPEVARSLEATDRRIMASGHGEVLEEQVRKNGELRTYQSSKAPWLRGDEVLGLIHAGRWVSDEVNVAERAIGLAQLLQALAELGGVKPLTVFL